MSHIQSHCTLLEASVLSVFSNISSKISTRSLSASIFFTSKALLNKTGIVNKVFAQSMKIVCAWAIGSPVMQRTLARLVGPEKAFDAAFVPGQAQNTWRGSWIVRIEYQLNTKFVLFPKCWNYGGSVKHNLKWILWGSHCGARVIVLSSFFTPYLVSRRYGSRYLSSLLMNRSPRAFARVPVLTRVNDSDTFILTQRTFGG